MTTTILLNELMLNLQLFGEGGGGAAAGTSGTAGDGGTGAESSPNSAVNGFANQKGVKNPLANVVYGKQQDVNVTDSQGVEQNQPQVNAEDLSAEFEEAIKGKYKDLYDKRVSETVQKRVKGSKAQIEKFKAFIPAIEAIADRYDVDPNDSEALMNAINADNKYLEDEALEKGMEVDDLKHVKDIERKNRALNRQLEEQKAYEKYLEVYQQAEEAKAIYPNLDLDAELENPQFAALLNSGIDVQTAYQALHHNEIIPQVIQQVGQKAEKKIANKIMANGSRPKENGTSNKASALTKTDVSLLTKADRDEIARRVARGEKISFS